MPKEEYFPLSGDVSQAINPWTLFTRMAGNQLGFINIHESSGSDPALEQHIVSEVAGYGRQLGCITDALRVLTERLDRSQLDQGSRQLIDEFEAMADRIDQAKATHGRNQSAAAAVDDAIRALRDVEKTNRSEYERQVQRLRDALPEAREPSET